MADIKKGLIFKDDNGVWLGVLENGSIASFNPVSDFDGVYDELPETKFCVVEIEFLENDNIAINDKTWVEIGLAKDGKDPAIEGNFESKTISFMLQDMEFPSEDADLMFASLIYGADNSGAN